MRIRRRGTEIQELTLSTISWDCEFIYSVSFLLRIAQTLRVYKWDRGGEVGRKG